ncbi:MAG: sodium:solute symporter [Planctomycetaceae bacterium]|nr:MAG: sodium:solute symporter [Planctomycetaceae bacterium]
MGQLTWLDHAFIMAYLLFTLAIGAWVSVYVRTGREFFLAGRTLPWWAVGVSLVATDIGGTDLIGVGGAAYRYGLVVANFEWIGCVPAMIVAAFVFIPHLWRCGVTTIPEYLERRFDGRVRLAVALCWVVFMACNLGVMLLASAKLMQELVGWPVARTIWFIGVFVWFYTWSGGLAAVVYTDVLQGLVMMGGCAALVIAGMWELGGWQNLVHQVHAAVSTSPRHLLAPHDYFRLVLPVDTSSPFPWPAILFGLAFIISPAYWMGNQAIVQRALGTRSVYEARAAYVWGALLKNLIPFLIAIPGLMAIALIPDLPDADAALPTLIGRLLPAGMKGVFIAAFLAALMSSVDSYLNSASTLLTHDVYRRWLRPQADERRLLWVGRWLTVLLTGWGIFFAFQLQHWNQGIYAIFQTLMSFFNGPAFAVLLAGVLFPQVNRHGALWGFWAGVITAMLLFLWNHPYVCGWFGWQPLFQIEEPFLYYSIWAFIMSGLVMSVTSYLTPADDSDKRQLSFWGMR